MRTTDRAREFFALYTRDFTTADFQRLFTHDTRDAYRFFARHIDEDTLGDTDRAHTNEQVAYVAFASPVVYPMTMGGKGGFDPDRVCADCPAGCPIGEATHINVDFFLGVDCSLDRP